MTWNERCLASIKGERQEIERKYNIRIGQTEIYCARCGKSWSTFHDCAGMLPERRAEVKEFKAEYDRPFSIKPLEELREQFNIRLEMSKQEALERFREWMESQKTCGRCEGTQYKTYCPYALICEEAGKEEEDGRQIDLGSGTPEDLGFEEAGLSRNAHHSGFDLCENI
jgi:hypothetical protein